MLAILVVEDDQLIQSLVEETLSDGGFEPAIVASGGEAVTLLKGHKGKYRALVTDINLHSKIGKSPNMLERSTRDFLLFI